VDTAILYTISVADLVLRSTSAGISLLSRCLRRILRRAPVMIALVWTYPNVRQGSEHSVFAGPQSGLRGPRRARVTAQIAPLYGDDDNS
jgi:hypothetical protein